MTRIIANQAKPCRPRSVKTKLSLAVILSLAATGAGFQLVKSDVGALVETAKVQIETCTIRGVGAAIASGEPALTLPTACRLAG